MQANTTANGDGNFAIKSAGAHATHDRVTVISNVEIRRTPMCLCWSVISTMNKVAGYRPYSCDCVERECKGFTTSVLLHGGNKRIIA